MLVLSLAASTLKRIKVQLQYTASLLYRQVLHIDVY